MKITCDAENTVESLGGVDEREDIPPGVEGRIDISDRLQMETSSGVESRLEIVPPNVAVFSTIKKEEEECRLPNPEQTAISMDNSVKREQIPVMTTVPDIGKVKERQIVSDSRMKKSRDGDITKAWKGTFVSRLKLSHDLIHLVTWKEHIYVISAEISKLKPVWRGHDCLNTFLKYKFVNFQTETIVAAEEEELWQELVMAEVGGLLDRKGKLVSTLSLYRFVDLMEILYKGDQR